MKKNKNESGFQMIDTEKKVKFLPKDNDTGITNQLTLYNIYVERIKKHYDLRLEHFKIYFGFNSGLLIVFGYLIKLYLDKDPLKVPPLLSYLILICGFIGVIFSVAWCLVAKNDREGQLLENKVLGKLENEIFIDENSGLYTEINKNYPTPEKLGLDIIDINIYMAFIFIIIWELLEVYIFYAFICTKA